MELYEEILVHYFRKHLQLSQDSSIKDLADILNSQCYQALQKIKAVIEDDSLDDCECFWKIEKIVCALEELGSSGGNRHDF